MPPQNRKTVRERITTVSQKRNEANLPTTEQEKSICVCVCGECSTLVMGFFIYFDHHIDEEVEHMDPNRKLPAVGQSRRKAKKQNKKPNYWQWQTASDQHK